MPKFFSFISCDNDAVVIDAVKKAEESDDIIVRLDEPFGGSAKCTPPFADCFKTVYLTSLWSEI